MVVMMLIHMPLIVFSHTTAHTHSVHVYLKQSKTSTYVKHTRRVRLLIAMIQTTKAKCQRVETAIEMMITERIHMTRR